MTLRISGKNMDIGEALRAQVEARVANAVAKYFDGMSSGHVTVARDGTGFRTECVLHLASGITLEASGAAHDAYASFDQTADRIEKRLRRYKRRLRDRQSADGRAEEAGGALPVTAPTAEDRDDAVPHPVVIAETKPLPRLSVSEAVGELDGGIAAIVFRHAGTGRVNVVYRRRDGMIGWVDPPAEPV